MRVRVNTIENKWDNAVVPLETTWDTFRAVIMQGHDVADDKESAKLFNAAEYRSADSIGPDANLRVYSEKTSQWCARRLADNVLAVGMLVLDYDGGLSLEVAKERFKDYEYVAYTSFSHRAEHGQDRFRVIFPLLSPIPATGQYSAFDSLIHGSAWHELQDALQDFGGPCDPVSFRCNQFYYLPLVNEARKPSAEVWSNPGKVLDWTTWKRVAPPAYTGNTDESLESGRYLDDGLDPDQMLQTQTGYIRVRDVVGRVEGVWCPYHDDHNGTEFSKRVRSGVFLYCRKCQRTYWMVSAPKADDDELITMDPESRQAGFVDASDRKHVSEQLLKIGREIVRDKGSLYSRPSHFVYLPEGSGKSRLAFHLAVSGNRIFFACKSMEQVFEKYDWFRSQARDYADEKARQAEFKGLIDEHAGEPSPVRPISVQLFLSKGAKARRRFGVDVVRLAPTNPFDAGDIDDEASIQGFIAANPNLSETFIRLSWRFFGPDRLGFDVGSSRDDHDDVSGPDKYESADIIVTTFAQARLLRLRNQTLPDSWTVWFDDPDVSDFADIEPYTPEVWGELTDEERREKHIVTLKSGRRYFKRESSQSLGAAVSRLRCVYTTTEQVTMRAGETLLRKRGEQVHIHDRMEGVIGGKITLLGTQYVYSSYDGIIPLMMRRLEKEGHEVRLIADGLGQSLNHSNSKGKNDLTQQNLIVELSAPHPVAVQTICDAMGVGFRTEGKAISRDIVMDQLHQALGRNSGYRFAGYECVALVPANLHAAVIEQVRYAIDEQNSVIVDRTASMGRKDRRTKAGASPLVLAVEDFLNNFDVYIQDGRKVLPDIKAVIGAIEDEGDRIAYAARLLHALTTISGIKFLGTPTAADTGHRLYSKYRDAVEAVIGEFPSASTQQRVITLYRARLEPKTKASKKPVEEEISTN